MSDTDLSDAKLADIAERFYLLGQTKIEIADEFGLSRFKIARLLDTARDRGIVEITVNHPDTKHGILQQALAEHLHMNRTLIVDSSPDASQEASNLGIAAANYVQSISQEGDNLGISWGRTLLPVSKNLKQLPPVTLIQLTGIVGNDIAQSPIEVASQIRHHSDAETKALFAPLFAHTPAAAKALLAEPSVQDVMSYYGQLNTALLAVGSWKQRVTQLEEHLSVPERDELDKKGVVADFCGLFFDADGRFVHSSLDKKRISVTAAQLAATSVVVAVASGIRKVDALHSVARSGLVTCLVTTESVAHKLLELPAVEKPTWPRDD